MKQPIYHDQDLGFTVWLTQVDDFWIQFQCYKIVAPYTVDGAGNRVPQIYERKDVTRGVERHTEDLRAAQIFLSGWIKWDGCSNMRFDEEEVVALHFCGRDEAVKIGKLMNWLYEIATNEMPRHAENLQ